jgi:hypothetical protein
MIWFDRASVNHLDQAQQPKAPWHSLDEVRGVVQRIDFHRREVRLISDGRVWQFVLTCDCHLWLNSTPANLRSIHPLDAVTVLYQHRGAALVARAIQVQEAQP